MTSSIITPSDLGLPAKFHTWRPGQWASIETTLETDKRFIAVSTPTGGGKSVYAVASAILEAKRAIYLTSSKGLQSQLHDDFSECGMIDMRGRQNYQCIKGNISCSEGRILECRDGGCPYNASRNDFLNADLASTNYAYYFSSVMHSEGVGDCGMLILDEAHAAVQELCNVIEIRLDHNKSNYVYNQLDSRPPHGEKISTWRTWAKFLLPKAQKYLKEMKQRGPNKQLSQVDQFVLTISRIASVSEDWILDESNVHETLISPLWPTDYASTYLFRDIPRIILASATLVPKTLSLLGIEEKDSVFLSQDHTFSPDRCPLYLFGACRVDYKMSPGQWQETIGRMDTIISRRLDRKGIIHTTSYDYQSKILRDSEHSGIMIAPKSAREIQAAIEEFRDSPAPRILVSPSITTGYDFPGTQCEYQILLKVPFIDSRSPVMKARSEADNEYLPYLVAQTLVQTCGRAMRCFDRETELLTTTGWKKWDEVKEGDTAYGIDTDVWSREGRQFYFGSVPLVQNKVLKIFSSEREEPMIHIKAAGLDAVVTFDHDMVVQTRVFKTYTATNKKPYGQYTQKILYKKKASGLRKLKASELPARFLVPVAGRYKGPKGNGQGCLLGGSMKESKPWFRLMGLIISDGYIAPTKATVSLYQSKPGNVDIIDELITTLGLNPKRYKTVVAGSEMCVGSGPVYIRNYDHIAWVFAGHDAAKIRDVFNNGARRRCSNIHAYRQRSHKGTHGYKTVDGWKDVRRDIPLWVFERASVSQLQALLEGLMLGDGSWNTAGNSGAYYTKEESIADRFQAVAALCGYRTNVRHRRGQIEITISDYGMVDVTKSLNVSDFGKALPWCVNTEVGTVLVRRNGKTFIAGNSADDRCENFLLDQHANWFLNKPEKGGYRHLVPGWFTRQIHWNPPGPPQPPPPLSAGRQ